MEIRCRFLIHGCSRRWWDAGKCKFPSVTECWSTAHCHKHGADCIGGFLHFCCSEMFPGTGHSSTCCSSSLTAAVLACYKGKGLLQCELTTTKLLSCPLYFTLPHVHACSGSTETGCYSSIAALWASKTAVRQYSWVVTRCSVPPFQNLTYLKVSSVAWIRPVMLCLSWKIINSIIWAVYNWTMLLL